MKVSVISRVAGTLTSRRGARLWFAASVTVVFLLFAALGQIQQPSRADSSLIEGSDSARVAEILSATTAQDTTTAVLVANRADGTALSMVEQHTLTEQTEELSSKIGVNAGTPMPSTDGQVLMTPVSWDTVSEQNDRDRLDSLRRWVQDHPVDGVHVQVTGSTAFAVDITAAFAGANFTLLAVTVSIVAILLILTYRSPILWLLPLAVVGVADRSASLVANLLGTSWGLHFDSGVLSVLVFGAGTNYALLLISRYRDELHQYADHREALSRAWAKSFEAILTSNLTAVLALITLGLAVVEDTRGLGLVCAAGLLLAAAFVLFVLPPLLAMSGRRAFWPRVPRAGEHPKRKNIFASLASAVMRKSGVNLAALAVLLLVLAGALVGTRVGLDESQQFRSPTESTKAMQVLAAHFPAGETQPMTVLTQGDGTEALRSRLADLDGVQRVSEPSTLDRGDWQQFSVISSADPGSVEARNLVGQIRATAAQEYRGTLLVGGSIAESYDTHHAHLRDLAVIAPLIMLICLLMLGWLTRSWLTALALGAVNLLSAAAALGLGSWVCAALFEADALDVQVPLLAFVFLVALGVDYTIFLTQRVRQNIQQLPLRAAVAQAAGHTGAVITSAGAVLAGVFAALATLPLTVLGQLGVIVGLGVLLDTFLVRTLLLPALFAVLDSLRRPLFGSPPPTESATDSTQSTESELHA